MTICAQTPVHQYPPLRNAILRALRHMEDLVEDLDQGGGVVGVSWVTRSPQEPLAVYEAIKPLIERFGNERDQALLVDLRDRAESYLA